MTSLHRVGLVGFGAFERSTFDLFFRTSQLRAERPRSEPAVVPVREHGYVMVSPQDQPDLVLINGDLRLAARQVWRWPGRVISVGAHAIPGAVAHLQRPVPMHHLLAVLDELVQHGPPEEGPGAPPLPPSERQASPPLLVVDDNPRTLRSIARYFVQLGAEANYASSGEEALYRVSQRSYALVLLDARMPGISGWLTCRLIKTRPYADGRRAPRVLVMTRFDDLFERWAWLRCRCDGVVRKPLRKSELLAAVRPYL